MDMRRVILFIAFFCAVLSASAEKRTLMIDQCIDSVYNLTKTYHQPKKYSLNPVLKADRPWELNANGDPYAAPFSGGVWFDDSQCLFKMWYSAGGGKKNGLVTCYAVSRDGKNWEKPVLDIVPGTNIVDTLEHDCVTVLFDKHETDSCKRYKMFNVQFDTPSSVSMVLKYSHDGIHWSEPMAKSEDIFDRCSAFYDPFREKYVLSLKTKDSENKRARNFLAHRNPEIAVKAARRLIYNEQDSLIRFWFSADKDDPRHPSFPDIQPAIYNHDAIGYEKYMLGLFNIWQGPENKDCTKLNVQKGNEILIGFSHDGFNWNRECKTPFIPVDENPLAWDAGNIQSCAGSPIIVGDSLYFYYSARYNSRPKHPSNFATGLATMRRDGFISYRAGCTAGYFITSTVDIKNKLCLNATTGQEGKIIVETIDDDDNFTQIGLIHPATEDCCYIISLQDDLVGSARLKFTLINSEIFSFWFEENTFSFCGI